jgi:hypothetical protein
LGAGANRCPRAIDAANCYTDGPCVNWEQDLSLEPVFHPVLGRIRILAEGGLTSMMVLHDYVSKHIAPLPKRTFLAWLYTGVNDVTRLERGDGSVLGEEVLVLAMGKLSPDLSSHDFITPPVSCQPLYMNQAVRMLLLVAMSLMDDVGIAPVQRGDQSHGIWIPRIGIAGDQVGAVSTPPPSRTRERWCESSTAMMRYQLTMMSHCKGGGG